MKSASLSLYKKTPPLQICRVRNIAQWYSVYLVCTGTLGLTLSCTKIKSVVRHGSIYLLSQQLRGRRRKIFPSSGPSMSTQCIPSSQSTYRSRLSKTRPLDTQTYSLILITIAHDLLKRNYSHQKNIAYEAGRRPTKEINRNL